MPVPVLQFGTSRFLQAHADLFIHEAREAGQDIGPITVVKTSPGPERSNRLAHLARPEGYPVRIRGLVDGLRIERDLTVTSIARALDAVRDWDLLRQVFAQEAALVISNTGDAGFAVPPADRRRDFSDTTCPAGFPAKLLALLAARFAAAAAPLLILPCELVAYNGQELRRILGGLARDWSAPAAFTAWLSDGVTICDTLVDRIVPSAIEPVGAIAEVYALWAIAMPKGLELPFCHEAVLPVDDLEPYLRLKLHILNLGHTWLAGEWLRGGRPPDETVREILSDPSLRQGLLTLYREEVILGFASAGLGDEARAYVAKTMDRFDNPYLDHPLRDIAADHAIKVERRCGAFLDWVRQHDPSLVLPRLQGIAGRAPQ